MNDAPAPHLVIVGAAGFTNLGDNAILAAMLVELRAALPTARLTIAGDDPAELPQGPGLTALSFTSPNLPGAIATADLLIIGGGGLFYDQYDHYIPMLGLLQGSNDGVFPYYRAALIAQQHGVPTMFYGVGVGPLLTMGGRRLARLVFSTASAITVRDQLSQQELLNLGMRDPWPQLTADPAVTLPALPPAVLPAGRHVGLVVRPWPPAGGSQWMAKHGEQFLRSLAAVADHLVERWDATPHFVAMQRRNDNDRQVADAVIAQMRHGDRAIIADTLPDYQAAQALFAGFDLLLSTRLHALILGGGAGVPLIGLPLDGKVRAFLASIDLAWCCHSTWHANPDSLIALVDRVLSDPTPVRASVQAGFAAQTALAAQNVAVVVELLHRERGAG